jgi:hypothetical protein
MYRAALFVALVVLAAACGSDDEGTATATSSESLSAADVESALQTQLSQGGSGVVHLETDRPKLVACVKDSGSPSGWRCTVTPSKGPESYLCMIEIDPNTKQITKSSCGRIDN